MIHSPCDDSHRHAEWHARCELLRFVVCSNARTAHGMLASCTNQQHEENGTFGVECSFVAVDALLNHMVDSFWRAGHAGVGRRTGLAEPCTGSCSR
eukprot:2459447-Pleurochrysis_carterae.AAC.1